MEEENKPFVSLAAPCIRFRLVNAQSDLASNDPSEFSPEFVHQIIGQTEMIFGYINPRLTMMYSEASLLTYMSFSFDSTASEKELDGAKPDDVISMVSKWLPEGDPVIRNLDVFSRKLAEEPSFTPPGEHIDRFSLQGVEYEAYLCENSTPGFRAFFERLRIFAIWFIECASYVDLDDSQWRFRVSHENGSTRYATVGYVNVYEYYAFPSHIRPRISQVLVLPPFQKQGIAARAIQCVYDMYAGNDRVVDVCVEDPDPAFTRVRDFVDVKNSLRTFQPEFFEGAFTPETAKQFQDKLKLNKRQARRVFEICKLRFVEASNPESMRQYRLSIKNRLMQPYVKEARELAALEQPAEIEMATEQQLKAKDTVHQEYLELEAVYQAVLKRVDAM